MKKKPVICLVLLCICMLVKPAYGDYLEVRRPAKIKAEPVKDAAIHSTAKEGTYLKLLDNGSQANGYYHVESVPSGQTGWIYRTLVRRYPGNMPDTLSDIQAATESSDLTDTLSPDQMRYAARHLRLGRPQAVYDRVREGYVLAQDSRLKIPLWVQYELNKNELNGPFARSDDFRTDTSIPNGSRAELEDYEGSGFDRGHMAPAADMNRSEAVMSQSFLLSNMAPQVGIGFNRHIWSQLESAIRGWVEQRGALTIITGPVFAPEDNFVKYQVVGVNHVAVPTHFFKIVVDAKDSANPATLAFMLPNEKLSGRSYTEFLTTIDEVEAATGLDFLSSLPVDVQEKIESKKAVNVW